MRPRRALNAVLYLVLLAPLAVQVGGCSIIGLTVGSIMDARRPPRDRVVPPGHLAVVRKGSMVELILRDSTRAVGKLIGVDRDDTRGYPSRYAAWLGSGAAGLSAPALGEPIEVVERRGKVRRAPFAGFGYRCVVLDHRDSRFRSIPFEDMREIRTAAGVIPAHRLAELDANGDLPTRVSLRIARRATSPPAGGERWLTRLGKQDRAAQPFAGSGSRVYADTVTVHTDQIGLVHASAPRSATATGLYTGLVLDGVAVLTIGIAAATYEPDYGCSDITLGGAYSALGRVDRPYDRWTGRLVDEPLAPSEAGGLEAVEAPPDERAAASP
jgi:hypothetical protein